MAKALFFVTLVWAVPSLAQGTDVTGLVPTVDVGSATTGVDINSGFILRVPIIAPGNRDSASRSFESMAIVAPGAQSDTYGVSLSGSTSPENRYVIDGLSVNDPAVGLNAAPLSVEFIQELSVITAGYMPEYGQTTGGILNAVTRSGSNEFHGAVWGHFSPGLLEGARKPVMREGSTVLTDLKLWNQGDFGVELGGPVLKDKLWFFVGLQPSFSRTLLERDLQALNPDMSGNPTTRLPGTQAFSFADERGLQYLGKLTWLVNANHNLSLSVFGTPTTSGGPSSYGYNPQTDVPEATHLLGPFQALAHHYDTSSTDMALKLASSFMEKRILLDATLGWHHQDQDVLPVDGSALGGSQGLAGIPAVLWQRSPTLHTLADFETLPPEAAAMCDAPGTPGIKCPLDAYRTGGPGLLSHDVLDRYQGRAVGTYFLNALGHHTLKVGADIEATSVRQVTAYSGAVVYRESRDGNSFQDFREYGYLVGPDRPFVLPTWSATSRSTTLGGFVQDGWNILDLITVNAGIRYDHQTLWGSDNKVAFVLPNEVSPRVGVVYDFTRQGRSRLFANYARLYENVPLDLIDRQFPGARQLMAVRSRSPAADRPGCNALDSAQLVSGCRDPRNLIPGLSSPAPDSYYSASGGDKTPVDPNLQPQSQDELVVGGEYELLPAARLGVSYTRRYMLRAIETMSRDEATTFFVGNPGQGLASDVDNAVRNYDAVSVYFSKAFSGQWLAQVSYTWSRLFGNVSGLFNPETGQLAPNGGSDFALHELIVNHLGPLPGDHTHAIKAYGAREFILSGSLSLDLGLTYLVQSGAPLNSLGSHPIYGPDEILILPRGSGGRLPWTHEIDVHLGVDIKLSRGRMVTLAVEVFNLLDSQQTTAKDQRYTSADVNPLTPADCGGNTCAPKDLGKVTTNEGGTSRLLRSTDLNPNYGNPIAYQAPRTFTFSARMTF